MPRHQIIVEIRFGQHRIVLEIVWPAVHIICVIGRDAIIVQINGTARIADDDVLARTFEVNPTAAKTTDHEAANRDAFRVRSKCVIIRSTDGIAMQHDTWCTVVASLSGRVDNDAFVQPRQQRGKLDRVGIGGRRVVQVAGRIDNQRQLVLLEGKVAVGVSIGIQFIFTTKLESIRLKCLDVIGIGLTIVADATCDVIVGTTRIGLDVDVGVTGNCRAKTNSG